MIKISVIIPVYNAAKFITPCLESVCSQSLVDIEIICIDDGSTDNTNEIIRALQKSDSRIIILNQKNSGSGAARNLGMKTATGEFIAFMDGDDWYPSADTLECLYNAAVNNNALISGGSFVRHFSNGKVVTQFDGIYAAYTFHNEEMVDYKEYQFDYGYHRFIYSREMLVEHNIDFPSYKRFQDPVFFVRAMIAAGRFYSVPKYVYAYRKGHQTVQWNVERIEGVLLGLTDNLLISRNCGLSQLHALSYTRFINEFLKMSLPYIEGSHRLYFCLQRLLEAVDPLMIQAHTGKEYNQTLLDEDFAWEALLGEAVITSAPKASPTSVESHDDPDRFNNVSTMIRTVLDLLRARQQA